MTSSPFGRYPLTGTVDDWQRIRARVYTVAEFGLESWCRSLRPILDQFVRAASGDVDHGGRRICGRRIGCAPDDLSARVRQHPAVIEDLRQVDDPSSSFCHP